MRRSWIVAGSVLTVVALVAGTAHAVDLLAREVVTERATLAAHGLSVLSVRTSNGDVEVVGADVDRVEVAASVSHGLWRTRMRIAVSGGRIELGTSCPAFGLWCGADFRVVVPRDLAVDVVARNGRIRVADLAGAVRVNGANGRIDVRRLTGDVHLETANGRVTGDDLGSSSLRAETRNGSVLLAFTEPPRTVVAGTRNGSVHIRLPDTSDAYRVDVGTEHGSTDIAIRTDPGSARTVTAKTRNGDIRLTHP